MVSLQCGLSFIFSFLSPSFGLFLLTSPLSLHSCKDDVLGGILKPTVASPSQGMPPNVQQPGKLVSDDLDSSLANLVGSMCMMFVYICKRITHSAWYSIKPKVYGHPAITAIYRFSPNFCHEVGHTQEDDVEFPSLELMGLSMFHHDRALMRSIRHTWPRNVWKNLRGLNGDITQLNTFGMN